MVTVSKPGVITTTTINVYEVDVTGLSSTGVLLHASPAKFRWLTVNNTRSSAAVYVKIYDKATAPDHATEDPEHFLKISAGGSGTIRFETGLQFTSGIGVAASSSAALDGAAPTVPPDINIGFS